MERLVREDGGQKAVPMKKIHSHEGKWYFPFPTPDSRLPTFKPEGQKACTFYFWLCC